MKLDIVLGSFQSLVSSMVKRWESKRGDSVGVEGREGLVFLWFSPRVRKNRGAGFIYLFFLGLIWGFNKEGTVWGGLAEWHCRGLSESYCGCLSEWDFSSLFKLCTYRLFLGNTYVFMIGLYVYSAVNKCRPVLLTLTVMIFWSTAVPDLLCVLCLFVVSLFVYTSLCLLFSNLICSFEGLQEIKEKEEAR